jgi:Alcohol dehydrogenase GroES-like domain
MRVGVSWVGSTDGTCSYCRSDRENLCDQPRFAGHDVDGGYAEYVDGDRRIPQGGVDAGQALINRRTLPATSDVIETGHAFGKLASSPAVAERLAKTRALSQECGRRGVRAPHGRLPGSSVRRGATQADLRCR